MANPLSNFPSSIDPTSATIKSYQRDFPAYMTKFNFSPEMAYYLMRAELAPLSVTND